MRMFYDVFLGDSSRAVTKRFQQRYSWRFKHWHGKCENDDMLHTTVFSWQFQMILNSKYLVKLLCYIFLSCQERLFKTTLL